MVWSKLLKIIVFGVRKFYLELTSHSLYNTHIDREQSVRNESDKFCLAFVTQTLYNYYLT